jgi:hypothetical protein
VLLDIIEHGRVNYDSQLTIDHTTQVEEVIDIDRLADKQWDSWLSSLLGFGLGCRLRKDSV